MCLRAGPRGRVAVFAGTGSYEGHEVLDGLRRHRRVDGKHGCRGDRKRDRLEVLVRIIGNLVEESWVHDIGTESEQQGIAIGRRLGSLAGADIARGTCDVLDIELLAEMLAELLRHEPR